MTRTIQPATIALRRTPVSSAGSATFCATKRFKPPPIPFHDHREPHRRHLLLLDTAVYEAGLELLSADEAKERLRVVSRSRGVNRY